MPTLYLDNLAAPFLLPLIQQDNIVPYPIASDFSLAWISQENRGRFCLAALTNDSLIGQEILITNKDQIVGDELAAALSKVSDKNITYISSTPDQFEENLKDALGDYVAKEVSNIYRDIDSHRDNFTTYSNKEFINLIELQTTEEWASNISW